MFRTLAKALAIRTARPSGQRSLTTSPESYERLKSSLRELRRHENPVPTLRQINSSSMLAEVRDWYKTEHSLALKERGSTGNVHARNAAAGHAVCYAMDAVAHLSHKYDLTLRTRKPSGPVDAAPAERDFLQQIHPDHARGLIADFRQSWQTNNEQRQAAILSALVPGVAMKAGLSCKAAHAEQARTWGVIPADLLLTEAELLALVDYVNSSTGSFNAVNGAALANAYYGEPTLQQMMEPFAISLGEAIRKLSLHPYFGKRDIKTYKGIRLADESGPFRRATLDAAVGKDKVIVFPNVLSATSNPTKSYAITKAELGYSFELEITVRSGFDADPFHDKMTMGESEILGPAGQRFLVTEMVEEEAFVPFAGRSVFIDRYVLKPAA